MQRITRDGPAYRTRLMERAAAERFARCLQANRTFTAVAVEESAQAKHPTRRFLVTFLPTNPERVADMFARECDARQARAESEGRGYLFVEDTDSSRRSWWCLSLSGETYQVTPETCTCPDAEYRPCPGGCKHSRALLLRLEAEVEVEQAARRARVAEESRRLSDLLSLD